MGKKTISSSMKDNDIIQKIIYPIKKEGSEIISPSAITKRRKILNSVTPISSNDGGGNGFGFQSKQQRRLSILSLTSLFSDCPDTIPVCHYNKNIEIPSANRRCSILSTVSFDSHSEDN